MKFIPMKEVPPESADVICQNRRVAVVTAIRDHAMRCGKDEKAATDVALRAYDGGHSAAYAIDAGKRTLGYKP